MPKYAHGHAVRVRISRAWRLLLPIALLAVGLLGVAPPAALAAPATRTAAPPSSGLSSRQERMLQLVNDARASAGVPPLAANDALMQAAQSYAQTMAASSCFSHTCAPVPRLSTRLEQAGYTGWRSIGENIAYGYRTADETFSSWINSAGHRANILSTRFRDLGVGVADGGAAGIYWVQNFGVR